MTRRDWELVDLDRMMRARPNAPERSGRGRADFAALVRTLQRTGAVEILTAATGRSVEQLLELDAEQKQSLRALLPGGASR